MSARDELINAVVHWLGDGVELPEKHKTEAASMVDAYRAEVLAEAKNETVAWLAKKAGEQETWDAGVLASKVDRGAVRAFLGTGHYRDAMDALRAEELRQAADHLVSYCPDHGTQATCFMTCQCLGAEELRDMAAKIGGAK